MRCRQVQKQLAGMSRAMDAELELKDHVAVCDRCRRALDESKAMDAAFVELRAEMAMAGPSDRVEKRVFAELHGAAVGVPPTSIARTWLWPAVGLVCTVVFVAVMLMTMRRTPTRSVSEGERQSASMTDDKAFTAMPYVVPPAPYERTTVVRTEVPLQTMVAAGFQVHGEDLSSSTPADVLYGEDGRILAIRLISQPNDSPKRMD